MRWRRAAGLVCLAAAAAATACGPEAGLIGAMGTAQPPQVVVHGGGRQVSLDAFTYCYRNTCADGRPEDLPDLGTVTGDIVVSFPLEDWTFQATQLQPAVAFPQPCDLQIPARLVSTGTGTWRLEPAGPPGRYRVDLFGRTSGGDLAAAFAVTTTRAGSTPAPRAGLGAFYDHDGRPDNYGTFEFGIDYLSRTPRKAAVKLTITGQGGRASYELARVEDECRPKGQVRFHAEVPNESVSRAVGREPYTIEVELELDGTRHAASMVWPRDVSTDPDAGGALTPVFTPALP
ncbi:hypothetical protein [Planotetraspora kaengkrachanensis]|uniref:hypothetical protein n=1 Tax=Planotetraspora kaengkrachanensis TaxID=575193 RepID=UPI0019444720|nr:hypothetical protein [Planotetraspora kaengkrachanensis]